MEKSKSDFIIKEFDGTDPHQWEEKIMYALMGYGLWGIVIGRDSADNYSSPHEYELKCEKAIAIIALNLSDPYRLCIRQLTAKQRTDPSKVWKATLNSIHGSSAAEKLVVLDQLLDSTMDDSTSAQEHISLISKLDSKLEQIGIKVHPDILLAIFLRSLPEKYVMLKTTLRHQGDITLSDAMAALKVEESALSKSKNEF